MKLMRPRWGLRGYVLEADRKDRDVVFVPVGDSTMTGTEDRVLIAADEAGTPAVRRANLGHSEVHCAQGPGCVCAASSCASRRGRGGVGTPVHLRGTMAAPPMSTGSRRPVMGRIGTPRCRAVCTLAGTGVVVGGKCPLDGVAH